MAMTNAERQKLYRMRRKFKLESVKHDVTNNVTQDVTIRLDKLEKAIKENHALLIDLINKVKSIEILLRNDNVTQRITKNFTDNVTQDKLIFDLDKSKAKAKDLKAQGMTANQIANELARRGYGNKFGKTFSKSSINKWSK